MTDLEITRLCAEAMGFAFAANSHLAPPAKHDSAKRVYVSKKAPFWYDPLHNDAQSMALVKKFGLSSRQTDPDQWDVWKPLHSETGNASNADLNRAICECVAKLQQEKTK